MKKKILAIALTAALATTGLTGCSNKGSDSSKKEEPYKVTFAYIGDKQPELDRIEKKINEIMKKDINMELDIEPIGWGSYNETIKLILSGGEKLDIVPVLISQASSMVNSKQLLDLSPLIDKYGTNMKEVLGDTVKAARIGDTVYGVTTAREWFCQSSVVMRKDIVDELNIDTSVIKSYTDLEAIYAQVKEAYPDMNMIASNSGCTPDMKYEVVDSLSDKSGVLLDYGQDTKVTNWYESDTYKDFIYTMRDWQTKAYLSKDAATSTDGNENQVKAGAAFSYFSPDKPGYDQRAKALCGTDMVIAPIGESFAGTEQISFLTYGINSNTKNPEKTMECLDYLYGNEEVLNLLNWGEEGVDYVFKDEANKIIGFPEGMDKNSATYNLTEGWQLFNQFKMHIWEGDAPDIWEKTKAANENALKSKAFGFTYDSSAFNNELSALTNISSQYVAALGSGTVDPDKVLPEFIKALKEAGIDKVIAGKQEQLDAWLANQ